ncbi:hypothetical protein HYV80_04390 [Candidatus Woesearchaeota archaeon]|nr:hypothetical protein [Candidatus Woesearchaeota archaeon]
MPGKNQPEDRLVGSDVIGLLKKLVHYQTGKPFTVAVDMPTATPDYTNAEISKAQQRGLDEITRRCQPARETWASLRDSLYDTGVMFKDPESGEIAINKDLELSEGQKQMYRRLESMLDEVNTFVEVR